MRNPSIFLFLTAFVLFATRPAFATIRTVCNFPANVAQFNSIQEALDASKSGDTLLVQGSIVDYSPATIQDKKITIIGPGFSPVRQQPGITARVRGLLINGLGSSGSGVHGLVIGVNGLTTEQNVSITNIRVIRNQFAGGWLNISDGFGDGNGSSYCSGFVIEGNFFQQAGIYLEVNNHLQNSIIQNNLFFANGIQDFVLTDNVVINHNLFFGADYYNTIWGGRNLLIENNIFCNGNLNISNQTNECLFKNNIIFGSSTTIPIWTINGNTDGGGNVFGQDPRMADQAAANNGTATALSNFTIASGPANNSASDGKDMGLLFDATGSLNWNNSRNSRVPYVYSLNIANNTIQPNGTLQVTLEARIQN